MFQPGKASRIFAACAALHNFAIDHGIEWEGEPNEDIGNAHVIPEARQANDNAGARVRDELVERVFT
jgi:hypothetical protein